MIIFPPFPLPGDQFSNGSDGSLWEWDGTKWFMIKNGYENNKNLNPGRGSESPTGMMDLYSPSEKSVLRDDFLFNNLNWNYSNGSITKLTNLAEPGRPGVYRRICRNESGIVSSMYLGSDDNAPNLVWEDFEKSIWIIKLISEPNLYDIRLGLSENWNLTNPTNAVYFEKLANDTTWFCVSINTGLKTRIDTGVKVDLLWNKFEIMNDINLNKISFKINDTLVGTIDINVPNRNAGLSFGNNIIPISNKNLEFDIDYFSASIRTTSR